MNIFSLGIKFSNTSIEVYYHPRWIYALQWAFALGIMGKGFYFAWQAYEGYQSEYSMPPWQISMILALIFIVGSLFVISVIKKQTMITAIFDLQKRAVRLRLPQYGFEKEVTVSFDDIEGLQLQKEKTKRRNKSSTIYKSDDLLSWDFSIKVKKSALNLTQKQVEKDEKLAQEFKQIHMELGHKDFDLSYLTGPMKSLSLSNSLFLDKESPQLIRKISTLTGIKCDVDN